ncbi:hypothetical protein WJX74_008766 [Apatococcus lobatus]|uniref:carotenoid 9,10-dioxygenase n=1 Tax=Apatococcus lobatus TaxID=904363 RepID=A0AAW1RFM0_9CHLO
MVLAVPANPYIEGNYAPTSECAPIQLEVEGPVPTELNGAYVRNGPNPVLPATGKCNWVDGDGMLHACSIRNGKVTYSSHQIRTAKLKAELQQGNAFHLKIGDVHGMAGLVQLLIHAGLILTGEVNLKKGIGTANTSVIFHNGRLQALQETDSPYEIELRRDGSMKTAGRIEIEGRIRQPFTAHPKIDPNSGELFYFDYDLLQRPLVSVGCLDLHGHLLREYPVDAVTCANLMHDFALTEHYIILYESPMKLDVQHMIQRNAGPFRWHPDEPTRLWVLDRGTQSSAGARCYIVNKAMNFMHTAAAFELGSTLYLYATAQTHFDMASADGTHLWGHQKHLPHQPQLYEFQLDLDHAGHGTNPASVSLAAQVSSRAAGSAAGTDGAAAVPKEEALIAGRAWQPHTTMTKAARFSLLAPEYSSDMPVISKACYGLRTRFIYAATLGCEDGITFTSLLKYDLEAHPGHMVVGQIDLGGPEFVGGEPSFVPMGPEEPPGALEEDAGYLVLYVHDMTKHETWLVIYNAQTFSSEPVARAKIPGRIPYGFHGLHISGKELAMQKCWNSNSS